MACALCLGLVGGAFAYFSDTETSYGNTFTAGTLDLTVDDQDDPNVVHITLSNLAPGWEHTYIWVLKNVGSIDGVVTACFSLSGAGEAENGTNEPEGIAEASTFTPCGGPLQTVGIPGTGELGYLMKAVPSMNELYPSVEKSPGVPCGNSYMPHGGGLHHLCEIGCFEIGRNTTESTLSPGESCQFKLRLGLAGNLQSWDGCGWHDIDDNVIQSDSVTFDITFRLEQVH